MSLLLHYDIISEWKRQFRKDLLTIDNVTSGQIKINKLSFPDGSEDDEANFWGYTLEKDGKKYLLSATDINDKEVDVKKLLPIKPKDLMKVATNGNVFYWIRKPVSVRIKPEQSISFKELVDKLTSIEHSNPIHQKLLCFMGLTQMFDRANFRISTPPAFGKDSLVDILGSLVGNAATLENPTLAKLEFMTTYSWLAVNEVVDIRKAEWKIIEQFLLAAGAFKPEITKHSRAIGGCKEVLDISDFSISLMYNDIDCYSDNEKYFDVVTKKAVLDRFPPLRLYGRFTEDFNSIKQVNIKQFVKDNFEEYKILLRNYMYYKKNIFSLLHNYDTSKLNPMVARWSTNIGRLLKIIDLYCDTQEEFDRWVIVVNDAMKDYKEMLKYPNLLEKASTKLGEKQYREMYIELKKNETFINKNILIKDMLLGKRTYKDVEAKTFWE